MHGDRRGSALEFLAELGDHGKSKAAALDFLQGKATHAGDKQEALGFLGPIVTAVGTAYEHAHTQSQARLLAEVRRQRRGDDPPLLLEP